MKIYALCLMFFCVGLFQGCKKKEPHTLIFAISAEYPPFEYYENQQLKGFDVELAHLIAQEMNTRVVFQNMDFYTILAALAGGTVDGAISAMAITPLRQKNFDFSDPYHFDTIAMIFPKSQPLKDFSLSGKNVACQLGTTMEIWIKKNSPKALLVTMDNNNQIIEALKAGHVDCVLMDRAQAEIFSQKNPSLSYVVPPSSHEGDGYGLVFPKESSLTLPVNQALKRLKEKGVLKALEKKWFSPIRSLP